MKSMQDLWKFLSRYDGLCLDDPDDRETLAKAVVKEFKMPRDAEQKVVVLLRNMHSGRCMDNLRDVQEVARDLQHRWGLVGREASFGPQRLAKTAAGWDEPQNGNLPFIKKVLSKLRNNLDVGLGRWQVDQWTMENTTLRLILRWDHQHPDENFLIYDLFDKHRRQFVLKGVKLRRNDDVNRAAAEIKQMVEDTVDEYETDLVDRFERMFDASSTGPTPSEHDHILQRLQKQWEKMGKEKLECKIIGGTAYGFGSELACLRIWYEYNKMTRQRDTRVGYSVPYGKWYISMENFV